jgi:hypothetical protein
MKAMNINMLFEFLEKEIELGHEIVFDFDQVLYDKGHYNLALIEFMVEHQIPFRICSVGNTYEHLSEVGFHVIPVEIKMILDLEIEQMVKVPNDHQVLVDDRAEDYDRSNKQSDRYICYIYKYEQK